MALTGFNKSGGGGSRFEPLSEGVHMARLVQVIDLGIQKDEYQGVVNERPKVMFTFEVPSETITIKGEEKPKFISTELTVSLHEKAKMPNFVKALSPGVALDNTLNLADLVGNGVQLNIGRTAGGNAKILGAMPLAKGQVTQTTDTPLVIFDFDNQDTDVLATLPNFVQEKITSALNYSGAATSGNSLPPVM